MPTMTIGAAVAAARAGRLTQIELAEKLGIDQGTVSRWENDSPRYQLRPAQIREIELVCDRPIGSILRAAGFVQDTVDLEGAIQADLTLSATAQEHLLLTLRSERRKGAKQRFALAAEGDPDAAAKALDPKRRRTRPSPPAADE